MKLLVGILFSALLFFIGMMTGHYYAYESLQSVGLLPGEERDVHDEKEEEKESEEKEEKNDWRQELLLRQEELKKAETENIFSSIGKSLDIFPSSKGKESLGKIIE